MTILSLRNEFDIIVEILFPKFIVCLQDNPNPRVDTDNIAFCQLCLPVVCYGLNYVTFPNHMLKS